MGLRLPGFIAAIAPGRVIMAGSALLLIACGQEAPPPEEPIRTVRTVTVSEVASGRARRFSGVVEASDSSSISFEVSGIINELKAEVGERISEGQVLAIMDDRDYRLNVEAAQASVNQARVEFEDAASAYARRRELFERNKSIAERAVEMSEAARDAAQEALSYAISRLQLAERDLERTVLRSPFTGIIANRNVDAFAQVARGQQVFEIFMEGGMEVAISVPESEIRYVYLSLPGNIRLPAVPDLSLTGIVSEISEVAGAANAFPVRVLIDSSRPEVRPGVSAEVTLVLGDDPASSAYLIPISALTSPPGGGDTTFIFRFDEASSTVSRVEVKERQVQDNHVAVREGIEAGDIIVTAGVSFLREGQKVRLLSPAG